MLNGWKIFFCFLLLSVLFAFPVKANAQVVINEFSSGSTSDWVELYNTATESADLSVYKLKDSTESNDKVLSETLGPGGFTFFTFSNYLNNDGDIVRLFKNDILVDSASYGNQGGVCAADSARSIGRSSDGTGELVRFSTQTQGGSNVSFQAICPTPTPTPSPTQQPTATPTPSPSPSPISTKSPTPIATPKKSASPTPTLIATIVSNEEPLTPAQGDVLGLGITASPTPLVASENVTRKKFPLAAVLFITGGLAFVGLALFMFFRSYQKEKSEGL